MNRRAPVLELPAERFHAIGVMTALTGEVSIEPGVYGSAGR
ncbi:MAG TPA: hypothetical protein VNB91_03455 [Jatrophihabitantaceae bacterium]|nr:hypothetical protein [Jatrophihabitantaceae bacterium]